MTFKRLKIRGFTLIELMIAVAIVAILAAIAWPQYTEFVRKSRRADGQAQLLQVSGVVERWFTENNAYPVQANIPAVMLNSPQQGTAAYTIVLANVAGPPVGYVLTATPVNDQANDTGCGAAGTVLTLSNTGATTPNSVGCWQ